MPVKKVLHFVLNRATIILMNNVEPQSDDSSTQNIPPKRNINRRKVVVFGVVSLTAFCFSFTLFYLIWAFQPRDVEGAEAFFTVSKGERVASISERLNVSGFIRDPRIFRLILTWNGKAGSIKAGEFILSPAMSSLQIIDILSAEAPQEPDVNVTIPEGFTVSQIDKKLTEAKIIQEGSLINGNGIIVAYEFIPECDRHRQGQSGKEICDIFYSSLEGYLFPDTYRFKPNSSIEVVVDKMLSNFNNKLSASLRSDIVTQNKSVKDIVILASMLEREVRSDIDKAIVVGIMWKRLAQSYPLQIDATVLYALELAGRPKAKGEGPTLDDLKIDSAYNTYKYKGLPPGPISNPGLASILAAVDAEGSPYFFYLSASDGTTVFSKTLTEHNRNKAIYLR